MSNPLDDGEEDTLWQITHLRDNKSARPTGSLVQKSRFIEGDKPTGLLDLAYLIKPEGEWGKLSKYGRCIVADVSYRTGDYVFVNPSTEISKVQAMENMKGPEARDFWVARILEIKAKNESFVYARVYWMYWPDDLPQINDCGASATGRRAYHGKHELIASNHMDILSVCTFAGLASVDYWQEDNDEDSQTRLYWRQTLDHRTGQLSGLMKFCVCESYYNPDKVIVSCPNKACNLWLHAECLIDDILTKKCQSLGMSRQATQGPLLKGRTPKRRKVCHRKREYEGVFSAKVVGKENDLRAEIVDLRLDIEHESRIRREVIICPGCGINIE